MNDMSQKPLWARKDEAVTCINGHAICHVSRNIAVGDGREKSDFYRWEQPQPDDKTPVAKIRCRRCRGIWIRGGRGVYQFHFAEGWR